MSRWKTQERVQRFLPPDHDPRIWGGPVEGLILFGIGRAHSSWYGAKYRCTNPRSPAYKDYGGRGIRMAPEWLDDFDSFLDYLGPRASGLSLDRIDVNGHYEPGNVRWATNLQQARNKRNSRRPLDPYEDWT